MNKARTHSSSDGIPSFDGIPTELFQILKDDAVKVLHQYVIKFGKLSSGHRTGKNVSFHHSSPKEGQFQKMFKLLQIALTLHASKIMLNILQARPQQFVIQELPDVLTGFRKGREARDQIATIH